MILFLDFDGVLHPVGHRVGEEDNFMHLPVLEDWLREHDHKHVRIVISSSWREQMDIDGLKLLFSSDLRERVIGKCPTVPSDPEPEFWRYEEIMAWIRETGYVGPWVALDDTGWEFPDDLGQLVLCDRAIGINDKTLEELSNKCFSHYKEKS